MTRKEKQEQFAREIYLQASFFKMKTTGSASIDKRVNELSGALQAFPHPKASIRYISPIEGKMSKLHPAPYSNSTLLPPSHSEPTLKESESTKVAHAIPEVSILEKGGRFYLRLLSGEYYQWHYESLYRAGKCLNILERSWQESLTNFVPTQFVATIIETSPAL